tara:strand:+ start:1081 stop:1230 length:150 start_codon:yes stop_codon:yes gene_type:complete
VTDKELEQWVRNNPWKANVIYPAMGIAGALFLQYTCIQIIDSFVTGNWV